MLSHQRVSLPSETTAMTANDHPLAIVLGGPLEAGDVLLDGPSNQLRAIPAPRAFATSQPIDARKHIVSNSDCNSFHIA